MKNIKVRTKLTIILALVIVLVTSESFISIKNMNQLKDKALETMDTSSRQNYDDSIKEQVGVVISLLSEIVSQEFNFNASDSVYATYYHYIRQIRRHHFD